MRTHQISLTIPAYGVSRTAMTDYFDEIHDGNFEGFIVATSDECRAARRSTLKPAKSSPHHDVTHESEFHGDELKVKVTAQTYVHELSLLSEIVGLGTQVDSQMTYLFPGESHSFTVTGPRDVLEEVNRRIPELLWSHNRVVNG